MPQGLPPFIVSLEEFETPEMLEAAARAVYASRHALTASDVESMLTTDADPLIQYELDIIMDEIAIDALDDSTEWAGVDADANHLTAPVRVFDVTGDPRTPDLIESHLFCYAPEKGR